MNPLHYPSIELCKKLTEAGFPETEYKPTQYLNSEFNEYVCPSVMELLDEMPKYVKWIPLQVDYWTGQWTYCTHCYVKYSWLNYTWLDLPNALAEMWLWLKENNYLTK